MWPWGAIVHPNTTPWAVVTAATSLVPTSGSGVCHSIRPVAASSAVKSSESTESKQLSWTRHAERAASSSVLSRQARTEGGTL